MTPLPNYSSRIGGSKSKQLDALFVLKDISAFASKTLTLYCFAAGFKLIFCFLKISKLELFNHVTKQPLNRNSHVTHSFNEIFLLFRKVPKKMCKYMRKGYPASP